jgi:hypothetical protein
MRRRTHSADVTADRLADHYEKWYDKIQDNEKDYFSQVINVLREIAAGER